MDYVLAFVTLIVVFIIPAAIVTGLVAQPEKKTTAGVNSQSRSTPPAPPEA
jgi:hypothetical protein